MYFHLCLLTEVDMAVNAFTELTEMDPYRLENMDYFSNTLYIKVRRCQVLSIGIILFDDQVLKTFVIVFLGNAG